MKKIICIVCIMIVFFDVCAIVPANAYEIETEIAESSGVATINAETLVEAPSGCLQSGVYRLKNYGNGMYMDVYDASPYPDENVIQWYASSSTHRNHMFKITYIGQQGEEPCYTIRSMTNSGLVLKPDDNNQTLLIRDASTTDDISSHDITTIWRIVKQSDGKYVVKKWFY